MGKKTAKQPELYSLDTNNVQEAIKYCLDAIIAITALESGQNTTIVKGLY